MPIDVLFPSRISAQLHGIYDRSSDIVLCHTNVKLTVRRKNVNMRVVEGRHPFGVIDTYNPKRCRTKGA